MFERFTTDARQVVDGAQREARELGHCWIGAEHLMLAVLAKPEAPGVATLHRLGLTHDAWRAALMDALGAGEPVGPRDAAALSAFGIDVEDVRRRVEAVFGTGALDSQPPQSRRRLFRRRRRSCGTSGRISFTDRAKRAVERSLGECLALHDRHIGVEHLVLGLLDPKGNLAVEILRQLRLDPGQLRAAVLADLGKAA